ncbi:hypothetical protein YSY22_12580 [Brevibacillus formosus]
MISAQNFIVNVEFFKEVRSPWGLRETATLGTKKMAAAVLFLCNMNGSVPNEQN